MVAIYGIKNCDTMKKAFRWLDEHNIEYTFHDYKKEGVDEAQAKQWLEEQGWENIINKRGTTWRKLDDETKTAMNNELALKTITDQPSMIKRPLLIKNNEIILGFKESDYDTIFNQTSY